MNKILIICGPTGTGKTKLALALAKKFNGELVSADSRQVYKGLDALTGKDRSKDIRIGLYDVAEREFSVAHFVKLARAAIADIHGRGKLPIVVGGTGFYLKALTEPVDTIGVAPNWKLRKKLASLSVEELQKRVEPKRLKKMNDSDRKNPRRLIRAIEVAGWVRLAPQPTYDATWIGLTAPLPVLRAKIEERVKARFDKAVSEVKDDLPPILGLEILRKFIRGEMNKEEAIERWINEEYQYAKRQLTWFRKQKQIAWYTIAE